MREHDYEPIPGLPEALPQGEMILWQGKPGLGTLLRKVMHLPLLAGYFAVLVAARVVSVLMAGASLAVTAADALWFVVPSVLVLLLAAGFAWGVRRTTIYTITNRRVVFRIGVALSFTANIPFTAVQGAAVRVNADGTGDVTLTIAPPARVSFVFFWPHARPWRFQRPEPTLRAIPDAAAAAQILARALAAASAQRPVAVEVPRPVQDDAPQAQPA